MNTPTILAAVVSPAITTFLIQFVVVLVICGILAFLLSKAPFIAEPWKGVISWVLIAIPVVYLIVFLLSFL